ncbi:hypothetical protein [Paenibacillus ehimensis]|uniref:Uncharacterized protein n=1 Tax=Paenibacillus ehimensis TaxID=79264 RepID=A0ABT8V2W8_9BACL|nr:hypothetical protein [Paenibacillus ehimensis]MDO3675766.1 hypothetical protein [Paenibacillus ehimensis]MEC0213034.1 hypothetical protein [Paenibacillus ehimensis]
MDKTILLDIRDMLRQLGMNPMKAMDFVDMEEIILPPERTAPPDEAALLTGD